MLLKMTNTETILKVCRNFGIDSRLKETKALTDGHINTTILAVFENG